MKAFTTGKTVSRLAPKQCQRARQAMRVRAEEESKVVREYSEAQDKVTAAEPAATGKPAATDSQGTAYIDELPEEKAKTMSKEQRQKLRDEYLGFGGSAEQPLPNNYFLWIILGISGLAVSCKILGYI